MRFNKLANKMFNNYIWTFPAFSVAFDPDNRYKHLVVNHPTPQKKIAYAMNYLSRNNRDKYLLSDDQRLVRIESIKQADLLTYKPSQGAWQGFDTDPYPFVLINEDIVIDPNVQNNRVFIGDIKKWGELMDIPMLTPIPVISASKSVFYDDEINGWMIQTYSR